MATMLWLGWLGLVEVVYVAGVLAQAGLARAAGMRVELVSFGFGPPLVRRGRWQLAAFPLGGFTRIAGLHATAAPVDSDDGAAFGSRPWPLRALVVLGWPIGAELALALFSAVAT